MPISVLFWNVNRKGDLFINELEKVACKVDILLLAESNIDDELINCKLGLKRIISNNIDVSGSVNTLTPKLYTRLPLDRIEHYNTTVSNRLIFFTLNCREYDEITLGVLHFPSKLEYNNDAQLEQSIIYAGWVSEIEKLKNHKRTILVGDFNMNPFEKGMISPKAFNATLSYQIAKNNKQRTFHYTKYDYFYNPMWNWLGDRAHDSGNFKTPGSYYYKSTTDVNEIYWNVFDKVIVRPEIIDYQSLKIIEVFDKEKLIKKNENIDHFPLTFNFNIN